MTSKKDLARETAPRYRALKNKDEKKKILDEFVANTGYNRKYAISVLNGEGKTKLVRIDGKLVKLKASHKSCKKRKYKRYYDDAVAKALFNLWDYFHKMGCERLLPLIRENMESFKHDIECRFVMSDETRKKLLEISRPTAERLLRPARQKEKLKGTCSTKAGPILRNQIPVKVYWPWDDQKPGFCEIDTVSHDGGNASSDFCHTLTVTEIAHQWTENHALMNNAHKWVVAALEKSRQAFPVPLRGIDSDNGSEFINNWVKAWCDEHEINFTRSRSYHKNDNCYVEQKNDERVRKTVGYGRFEGEKMRDALEDVYSVLNLLANYFYPCKKLIDKQRVGGKTKKIYDKPATPYQRIMDDPEVAQSDKDILRQAKAGMNVIDLQDKLDKAIARLLKLSYDKAKEKASHG